MQIAIQPSPASRVRALAEANPGLSDVEIARRLRLKLPQVRNALLNRPRRRIKSVVS